MKPQPPTPQQQFVSGAPPGMPSPSLMANGQFVLPPGWREEQSQLTQPLSFPRQPRHQHSPSLSSLKQQKEIYEIDKETGAVSSTRSVSPQVHSPVDDRRPVQQMGEPSRSGYQAPNPPFAQQAQGSALGRVSTNNTQGSQSQDEPDGRRSSNMFSSIRTRLAGNASERRDSAGGPHVQFSDVPGDGVSEASIPTENHGRKALPTLFGLRNNGSAEERASYESGSNPASSAFSPPDKRRFFNRAPSDLGIVPPPSLDQPRPATTEGTTGPLLAGVGSGQTKKRFSKIAGMLSRDKQESPLSQPQVQPQPPFAQASMGRSSLSGQRPFPGSMGSPGGPPIDFQQMLHEGRPRSSTAGSRPSLGGHGRNLSAQGFASPPQMVSIQEEDRGRKFSAGTILSNILGKRSDSKTREQQLQLSASGLGQPQGMMQQGQTPPRPAPGQFPSFLAHSMGLPGQPPINLPPQGQYAGLANHAPQQQTQQTHQQQFLDPSKPRGMPYDKFNNYLQGRASPGVSPVTQSSGSPLNMQQPGSLDGGSQQPSQGPIPQSSQSREPSMGVVQIATAVPIRQVERSPNGNTESVSGQNSPDGEQSRGRSTSVVNQIEVGRGKPTVEQTRSRAASHAIPQQQSAHVASFQAPVRSPNDPNPTNGTQAGPEDGLHFDPQRSGNLNQQTTSQVSPQVRRASTNLLASQNHVGAHSTPSTSPAPSYELPAPSTGLQSNQQSAVSAVPAKGEEPDSPQETRPSNQGRSVTAPAQPSVYRPSGPQIAIGSQQMTQSQTRIWSTSQNINGRGSPAPQPIQYSMQGRPPQEPVLTAPFQEQRSDKEGTFSKFITKSKTFVQDIGPLSTEKLKGDKDSKREKLMSAFKKPKQQQDIPRPSPQGPPPGGPGPEWNASSAIAQDSPKLERFPPNAADQEHIVTKGLQAMPSKAASLLGQPPNAMFQGPDQDSSKPRPRHERSSSPPYPNHQDERQVPGKTTPPLSPDQLQGPRAAPGSSTGVPPPQPSSGRPSISSLPSNQGPQSLPSQAQPETKPQHQQQASLQQPQQPRIPQPQRQNMQGHNSMANPVAANNRTPTLKQQSSQHDLEPQYAEVPIPQGYAPVSGAQTAAPRLKKTQSASTQPNQMAPNQSYQGHSPQQPLQQSPQHLPQQWMHPVLMPTSLPGQMPMQMQMPQAVWPQYSQYQGTPPPMMHPYQQPSPQQYTQGLHGTPSPPIQGQALPPGVLMQQPVHHQIWQQQPNMTPVPQQFQHVQAFPHQITPPHHVGFVPPQETSPPASELAQPTPTNAAPPAHHHFSIVHDSPTVPVPSSTNPVVQPQIHQPSPVKPQPASSPQQTVPRSTFAVQSMPEQSQLQPNVGTNGNTVPQRQISAASEVSSLVTEPASQVSADTPRMQASQAEQQRPSEVVVRQSPMQPASPVRQRAPVTLRDNPMPPKVDTPVTATPADRDDDKDDIYGATPRLPAETTPRSSSREQQHVIEHIAVGSPSPSPEPNSKFAGMPDNKPPAETTKLEYRVVENTTSSPPPPQQQSFSIMSAPPVIIEPQPTSAASSSSPATAPSPSPSSALATQSKSALLDDEPPSPTASELGGKKGRSPSAVNHFDYNYNAASSAAAAAAAENGDSNGGVPAAPTTVNGKPVQSSQEIFEEHKRKQLLRDMEEKIAVMPTEMEPEFSNNRRRNDDSMPVMSATSYPGQEWNPYGDGFEDFEE